MISALTWSKVSGVGDDTEITGYVWAHDTYNTRLIITTMAEVSRLCMAQARIKLKKNGLKLLILMKEEMGCGHEHSTQETHKGKHY